MRELVNYRADILCLQEVQADHFENYLEPELAKYNYAGLYKCKTREFMGQYGKMDGCAIFYRRDKFSVAPNGIVDLEFNTIARQRHSSDKRLLNRLLKDNIAQVSFTESTSNVALLQADAVVQLPSPDSSPSQFHRLNLADCSFRNARATSRSSPATARGQYTHQCIARIC